jgi:hypothetical protein
MGKVGSTSVVAALQRLLPAQKIHQTHLLSDAGILRGMEWWLDQPTAPEAKVPDHLLASIELGALLAGGVESAEWYLVCLVREPLGRNVSAFFQDLHRQWLPHLPETTQEICRRALRPSSNGTDRVSDEEIRTLVRDLALVFDTKFPHAWHDRWFDDEMRDVFGIDVFAEPFPTESGFQIHRHGPVRLLLLRVEDLPRAFDPAVREWLSGSPFAAAMTHATTWCEERSNDGGAKRYADLYRTFLADRLVSSQRVAEACESRTARHFYTPAELAEVRSRWEPKLVA